MVQQCRIAPASTQGLFPPLFFADGEELARMQLRFGEGYIKAVRPGKDTGLEDSRECSGVQRYGDSTLGRHYYEAQGLAGFAPCSGVDHGGRWEHIRGKLDFKCDKKQLLSWSPTSQASHRETQAVTEAQDCALFGDFEDVPVLEHALELGIHSKLGVLSDGHMAAAAIVGDEANVVDMPRQILPDIVFEGQVESPRASRVHLPGNNGAMLKKLGMPPGLQRDMRHIEDVAGHRQASSAVSGNLTGSEPDVKHPCPGPPMPAREPALCLPDDLYISWGENKAVAKPPAAEPSVKAGKPAPRLPFAGPGIGPLNLPSHLFMSEASNVSSSFAPAHMPSALSPAQAYPAPNAAVSPSFKQSPLALLGLPSNLHYMYASNIPQGVEVGRGAFAVVTCHGIQPFGSTAIKWMPAATHMDLLLHECRILAPLSHPNVVQMHGVVLDASNSASGILFEYCPQGCLSQYLRALPVNPGGACFPRLSLRARLKLGLDIARGMQYLHHRPRPVVHFDLKTDNILLSQDGMGWLQAKVADFGLSKLRDSQYIAEIREPRGTLPYMAPEVVCARDTLTEAVDVWSLGVVFWEMLTCEQPHEGLDPDQIKSGLAYDMLNLPVPSSCEPEWAYLIKMCMQRDVAKRISISELVSLLSVFLDMEGARLAKLGTPWHAAA